MTANTYKQTEDSRLQANEPVIAYQPSIPWQLQQRIAETENKIANGLDKGRTTTEMWQELKKDFPWLSD